MRFGWKKRITTAPIAAIEVAVPESSSEESSSSSKVVLDEQAAKPAASCKSSKKDSKEGKKNSNDGNMMDIGVWNPDAVKGNPNPGIRIF